MVFDLRKLSVENKSPSMLKKKSFDVETGEVSNREKLLRVLGDLEWHSTRDLVQRVGHTFARAKFMLVASGYDIEKRRHEHKKNQWQYRLVDVPTN